MSIKSLAEGIILQSMEDIWSDEFKKESLDFFKGGDFRVCAEMAGMNLMDQVRLLKMVKSVIEQQKRKVPVQPRVASPSRSMTGVSRRQSDCIVR